MALKILFGDDSKTAQKMGTTILSGAGYDVTVVSNGAAALKKMKEARPDIIIVDVFLPGYSGLEICEKVRAAAATASTPVLLTVGKLEPYRPEDGARVKADGVIVKPFEASDLLSIVKEFERKITAAAAEIANRTTKIEVAPPVREEWKVDPKEVEEEEAVAAAPTMQMSQDQGSSAAFGDFFGESSTETPAVKAASTPSGSSSISPGVAHEDEFKFSPSSHREEKFSAHSREADHTAVLPEPVVESQTRTEPEADQKSAEEEASIQTGARASEAALPAETQSKPFNLDDTQPIPERQSLDAGESSAGKRDSGVPVKQHPVAKPLPQAEDYGSGSTATEENQEAKPTYAGGRDHAFEPTVLEASSQEDLPSSGQSQTDPALVTDPSEMAAAFPTRFGVENPEPVAVGLAEDVPQVYAGTQAGESSPAAEETGSGGRPAEAQNQKQTSERAAGTERAGASAAQAQEGTGVEGETVKAVDAMEKELAGGLSAEAPGVDHNEVARIVHGVMERLKPDLIAEISRHLSKKTGKDKS